MTSARLSVAIRASAFRAEPLARVLPQSDEDGMAKVPSAWPAEAVVARPDRLTSSPRSSLSGLANPAKRGVHRGFESAQRSVARHDAFGQGMLGELCAQPRHSVIELARVHVDERALFFAQVRCSGSSLRHIPRSAAGPPRGYSLRASLPH